MTQFSIDMSLPHKVIIHDLSVNQLCVVPTVD